MTEIVIRNVDVIAAEINSIKDQTRKIVLGNSIEIGRRLAEAKSIVSHGEWGKWLQESVDYSQSTANNLMRIFEEYGANQLSLFGDNAKSQALGNLSYTQAVALLGVPAEEREEFVEKHDIDEMSTRELQAAIREKQELDKQLKESLEREQATKAAREVVSKRLEEVEKESKEAEHQIEQLKAEIEAAKTAKDDKSAAKLKTELRKAEKAANEAQQKIVDLEKQIEEKIKQREAELEAELAKREKELTDEANQRQAEAEKQIAALQNQLKKNDNKPVIKFTERFEILKVNFKSLIDTVAEIQEPEEKEKYKSAIVKLCDMMKGAV